MDVKQLQENEKSLDLLPLFKVLLSKLWLMIVIGAAIGSVAFGMTKLLVKPVYRCGFTAYVNNQQAQLDKNILTSSDLVAAQQLTKTYGFIIRSNTVLSASLESIESNLSFDSFKKMVYTEIKDGTELISVYVTNQDPDMAYRLANAVAETAPKYMAEIVEGSSMKIVDYPEPKIYRYGPHYTKYGMLGFLIGVLIVTAKTVIDFFTDDRVKSELQLEERFAVPILGIVPDGTNVGVGKNNNYYSSYGYSTEKNKEKGGMSSYDEQNKI